MWSSAKCRTGARAYADTSGRVGSGSLPRTGPSFRLNGVVSSGLLRAYRQTRYAAAGVEVRIGRPADAALGGCRSATLITAWNPLSKRMCDGWNHRRQCALGERLRRFPTLPADGRLGTWHEAHWMVMADHRVALRLARVFRQRALVVVRRGVPTRLVLLAYGIGSTAVGLKTGTIQT
jgi:hypothetical protein